MTNFAVYKEMALLEVRCAMQMRRFCRELGRANRIAYHTNKASQSILVLRVLKSFNK